MITVLLSVTVVYTCAVHQFAAMISARTLHVVCLPLHICMNGCGTTQCIRSFCESILSCLPSECIMPCLHDLLEFRHAQRVPRFGDLLAFILITISVSSEFEKFDKKLMFVMCSGVARRATWEATPSHINCNRSACFSAFCNLDLLLVGGSAVSRIHGFQRKERISPTHIYYLK